MERLKSANIDLGYFSWAYPNFLSLEAHPKFDYLLGIDDETSK